MVILRIASLTADEGSHRRPERSEGPHVSCLVYTKNTRIVKLYTSIFCVAIMYLLFFSKINCNNSANATND